MDELTSLGNLLKLPSLEDQTIKLINEKMRLLVGAVRLPTPDEVATQNRIKNEQNEIMKEWLGDDPIEGDVPNGRK